MYQVNDREIWKRVRTGYYFELENNGLMLIFEFYLTVVGVKETNLVSRGIKWKLFSMK